MIEGQSILIAAYACHPEMGSEPGVGWNWTKIIAANSHVTVLTRPKHAQVIRAQLDAPHGLSVIPIDVPVLKERLVARFPQLMRLHYILWQWELSKWVRAGLRNDSSDFGLAHHLTFASDWVLPGLCSAADRFPVVWGPVGGASRPPLRLWRWLGLRGSALEVTRRAVGAVGRWFVRRFLPGKVLILAQNSDTLAAFSSRNVTVATNVLVDDALVGSRDSGARSTSEMKRALFPGRLLPWKGTRLALHTIAKLDDCELIYAGSGPDSEWIEQRAARLGISDRVRLVGHLDQQALWSLMSSVDVMLFPSMHDSAAWVVAEAVAVGLPVVCLGLGGPPGLLSDGEGIIVNDFSQPVDALAEAVRAALELTPPGSARWCISHAGRRLESWYLDAL